MAQGAADWYIKKPFILAVLGTSLSAGRLSGNLWWQRLMVNARAQPEAVGPVVLQNFGKGSQQSTYGVTMAPDIAAMNPTHILSEGFAINDCAALPSVISRPDHLANMAAMRAIWKAKNPAVDITWQTMNGVSAAGAALRPDLQLYYDDEIAYAAGQGDTMLDHYYGLPSPPAIAGGWPKPLPEYMTDNNDGLHPIWDGSLELYFWPGLTYWLRVKMALHWGLAIPNPPNPPPIPDASYLIAAGGAGGGGHYGGGGGGAGGRRRGITNLTNLYGPVLVGFGGVAGLDSPGTLGGDGGDSILGVLTSRGGGGGGITNYGATNNNGRDGGSGGGSAGTNGGPTQGTPGAGEFGQGFAGGQGAPPGGNGSGGAGGGAAGVGQGPPPNNTTSMQGGAGVAVDVPGVAGLTICAGGPAGCYNVARQAYLPGAGPTSYGGGGFGSYSATATIGRGDPGGDGVIWAWYPGAARAVGGTVTTFGGFTIHQFTRADCAPHVKLTSNASSGYTIVTSTAYNATYDGWKAMNGVGAILQANTSDDNAWVTSNGAAFPHTFRVQLPVAKAFKAYRIQARDFVLDPPNVAMQCLKDWVLEGANNPAGPWTVCDTRVGAPAWTTKESRVYDMNGPGRGTVFLYYRLTITALQGNNLNRVGVAAFDLLPALDPL